LENVGIFNAIWNILWTFGVLVGHLVHFGSFGTFFPVLVSRNKKNLATLIKIRRRAMR
jgi:hypothetical protein